MHDNARYRNRLLNSMRSEDLALLEPSLERVDLTLRLSFDEANKPTTRLCFPEIGVISVVAFNPSAKDTEVGMIGREGVTGGSFLLGVETSAHDVYVQMPGHGWRIEARLLQAAMRDSATLSAMLLRYVETFLVQTSYTAVANSHSDIEQRLARWLLMIDDRMDGHDFELSHEFLAAMLGARRPGVTNALHVLEGRGLIRSRRLQVVILDRGGLEQAAGPAYGSAEAHYGRVFGPI